MIIVVESAVSLDVKQTHEIESLLNKKITGKFTVKYEVNPEILGGLRLTRGGQRLDLSVLGKLNQIKKAL